MNNDLYHIGTAIVNSPHMSIEEINSYLTQQVMNNPEALAYTWQDPDGTGLASSIKEAIGGNARERDYYNRILAGEDFVVSEVILSRADNEPVLSVYRAIREGPKLLGILATRVNVAHFDTIMPKNRTGVSTSFGITDKNGVVVYREGYPNIIRQMIVASSEGPVTEALDSVKPVKGKKFISAVTNTTLLGVAIPLPEVGGMVAYANSNYREITGVAFNSVKINILALIITTILSLLLAIEVSKKIVRPMNTLQHFARKISAGDMEASANIPGNNEIAATGQALNQMASRIKLLEDDRRMFIQASAHEMRNPMSGIKGINALIKRQLLRGKPVADVINMVDIMDNEIDRLATILNQVLSAFKEQSIHSFGAVYNLKPINITDLVIKVAKVFRLQDENFSIALNVNRPVFVNGDAARLEDVLRNLLNNAVKYSPDKKEIVVSLQETNDIAIISVQDKGMGITESQLEHIFDSFVRGKNLDGADPGGIGLGLYICKDIITKHGGSIWAKNNSDKGSTFYIKLPVINILYNDTDL